MTFCRAFVLFSSLLLITPASAESLHFKEHGFSIKPLAGHSDTAHQQVLSMQLPPENGFAANVNVSIEPFKGTLDEYERISLQQLKQAGLDIKIIDEKKLGSDGMMLEYSGLFHGTQLHWYQRVQLRKGKAILATATARDDSWSKVGPELKATVDSFKTEP